MLDDASETHLSYIIHHLVYKALYSKENALYSQRFFIMLYIDDVTLFSLIITWKALEYTSPFGGVVLFSFVLQIIDIA